MQGSLLEGNMERQYDIGFRTALCTGIVERSGGGPIYSPEEHAWSGEGA